MIAVAPMQGFTDAAFRHFHADIYGAASFYTSPFLRFEHGEVRRRDLRDITSTLNEGIDLLPQVIFRDRKEFDTLVDAVASAGFKNIDLNLGCPFPPQVKKGRGAALITNIGLMREIAEVINSISELTFSVKMRLGVTDPYEYKPLVPILNSMRLSHVTMHPRIAAQQYGGELYEEQFTLFKGEINHKLIFNGDVATPSDIDRRIAEADGVMIGRGLLARPSLIAEWRDGEEWTREKRLEKLLSFHEGMYAHYADSLCGEAQILMKIKPFWEYLEPEIGRKAAKLIRKATSLSKYEAAVAAID